eukprot:TRINITY_DN4184_c0_g1_i1.p2 TRINITY_DN4184_c0_g1~~TRINITY_DN4184_c0_g1_i1.p2  ORF type:complete len:230 (-),score=62.43 TRINITY_DN4184_c0_g1_i1:8-697(-)
MAYEILLDQGYDHSVDFWSLGVILYELLFGITPFAGDTILETFQKIQSWESHLAIPDPEEDIDEDVEVFPDSPVWDLIQRLICSPEKRIGNRFGSGSSFEEIKSHAFFEEIDFDELLNADQTDIPFIPQLKDEEDKSYFDNALDEEDYLSMDNSTIEDILSMPPENVPADLLTSALVNYSPEFSDKPPDDKDSGSPYKKKYKDVAFKGLTFKHQDMDILVNMKKKTEKN